MNRVGHVLKSGRTSFYQSNVVRDLFGNVLRPGGLVLARHLGEVLELTQGDEVLDVACGHPDSDQPANFDV